jgi:hypothetical protein
MRKTASATVELLTDSSLHLDNNGPESLRFVWRVPGE